MAKLTDVEGIGPIGAKKLQDIGIHTQEQLLEKCADKAGRKEVAKLSDLSEKLILNWVNRADLARVPGVGEEYADLLELAGVDSVPELAQRNPSNLHERIVKVNEEKKAVRAVPSESTVVGWVEKAHELPKLVTH